MIEQVTQIKEGLLKEYFVYLRCFKAKSYFGTLGEVWTLLLEDNKVSNILVQCL